MRFCSIRKYLGFAKLLVIQRHHITCSQVCTYHCEGQSNGGGLFRYDLAGGQLDPILDASAGQILSYDVSFDGRELLVAWRNGPGPDDPQRYQIYRMNIDGSDLRQLTPVVSHAIPLASHADPSQFMSNLLVVSYRL